MDPSCVTVEGGGCTRYTRGPDRWIATGSKHGAHFSCTLPMLVQHPLPFTPTGLESYSGVGPSTLSGGRAAAIGLTPLKYS